MRLAPLEADGLVAVEGNRIRVSDDGRPLVRTICAVFDGYLDAVEERHARTI